MKLKSGAGHGLYVKNIDQTIEFYTKLGLELKEHSPGRWVTYINWYRIDFIAEDTESPTAVQIEDQSDDKGAGAFFYFSVDNVDATYKELLELGLTPDSQPADMSWGNREFILRDPDGYKLVMFKRKVAKNPQD